MKKDFPYIHGFSPEEQERLKRQADIFEPIIYQNVDFFNLKDIIEIGSGIGAQTEILLRRFPHLSVHCVELNERQIATAQTRLAKNPLAPGRYEITKADASNLDFDSNSFDGAFLCWVLEHVPKPLNVLSEVRRVVRNGGQIVVNEVNNSSFFLDPYSSHIWKYWMAFNDFQFDHAGDPFVGVKLGNYLQSLGFQDIETEVKTLYFDKRQPERRRQTLLYWTDLLLSASEQLVQNKYIDEDLLKEVKKELRDIAADPNAIFYYSFIQARATV